MSDAITFLDDQRLRIGSSEFWWDFTQAPDADHLVPVIKPRALIQAYADLQARTPKRVVELGLHKGGSTIMLSELLDPETLVAIELSERPLPLLDAYLERRHLHDRVRVHLGIDQADRSRVAQVIDTELDGNPIDLVIDDASHRYEPTLASFEVLFPRLAPGGLYIIEDWRWEHRFASSFAEKVEAGDPGAVHAAGTAGKILAETPSAAPPPSRPFSHLVQELFLAVATGAAVHDVSIAPSWVTAVRGAGELDPSAFRLRDHYRDHFGQLSPTAAGHAG